MFDGTINAYGTALVLALLAAWGLARRNAREAKIDPSHIDLLTPLSFTIGIVLAITLSRFWTVDLSVLDGLLEVHKRSRLLHILAFCALAVFVYSRIASLGFRRLLDVFAVPTIVGIAVLRFGCFVAGCCWGDIAVPIESHEHDEFAMQVQSLPFMTGSEVVTAVTYPAGSFAFEQHLALGLVEPGATESLPVHAVQLYEAAALLLLALSLYRVSADRFGPGMVTALAAGSYGLIRFLLEYLRADNSLVAWSMTLPQIQSLMLLAAVVLAVSYQLRMNSAPS